MGKPLLELRNLSCFKDGQPILDNLNLVINEGDIVVLRGKSGSGKTTLLKCIAHLFVYEGQVLLYGRTPRSYGIPSYRTRILYVPQRPSLLPGSPRDFLLAIISLNAHQADNKVSKTPPYYKVEQAIDIATAWGIDSLLWDREWSNLSGGEAQRIALAVAAGLNTAEVILLDEPTSALDAESSSKVERFMLDEIRAADTALKAIVWITHSEEQGGRVGTRFLHFSAGGYNEEPRSSV